jgi:AcrR family transcriptional regulator
MALGTMPKTRDRILHVALGLFNERGSGHVTTAEIAEAAGINEGNLYYYFQRKDQLAQALFELFEHAMLRVAEARIADPAVFESYGAYQRGWFRLMWDFRFFYRATPSASATGQALQGRLRALNATGQAAVRRVFLQMRENGLLSASAAEIDILVKNLWIVAAHWMDFRLMETGARDISQIDLAWGFRQVEMLYRPYLTAKAKG